MKSPVCALSPLFIIIYPHHNQIKGMALPVCPTRLPTLSLPQGFKLGTPTGQRQTDGLGKVTRVEIQLPTLSFWCILRYGKGWCQDWMVLAGWFKNRRQPFKIWVKPNQLKA
ncbi:hypothetical protein P1X15_27445 [Runella sp. MFBS21]|uniref:hypothetical protein n=1 Tax=Runella sp. MFBS21 TaxID=3034018 RepID=UPI0023F89769|nr:hypothetical protein [Runella sp. MFBS21]MDF7821389.1 hypothetical protein [Runella sp. MFBS21]